MREIGTLYNQCVRKTPITEGLGGSITESGSSATSETEMCWKAL